MKPPRDADKPPFELIEESFHLVRMAPASALAAYHLGSLPFIIALLYFWSDMSRSAFADQRLVPGVLLLTGLFVWMKGWQSIYCQQLLARLCGGPPPRWTPRTFLRVTVHQAIVQPAGLFLIPIAALLMFPAGWTYGFFSVATVVHGAADPNLRAALARTWRLTCLWPLQNHYVLSLFGLFGFIVFANIFSALLGVPFLMKSLLGLESVFTRNPWAAMNSTLLMAQLALTYLCLDPVVKAAYVLRAFYGDSLRTGQDLRAELNALQPAATANLTANLTAGPAPHPAPAALVLLVALRIVLQAPAVCAADPNPSTTPAASPTPLSPATLDRSIERTIQKREYSWRLPPEDAGPGAKDEHSLLARLEQGIKAMARWIEDAVKWLVDKIFSSRAGGARGGAGFAAVMETALILLVALLLGLILWMLVRLWQQRPRLDPTVATALPAPPDLADEAVTAAELPQDGWIRLAREHLAKGEARLALRAFYLASLSNLGDRRLITLARGKSNHDYERELRRRAHALGTLAGLFAENLTVFERVWYGRHPASPELVAQFTANLDRMQEGS